MLALLPLYVFSLRALSNVDWGQLVLLTWVTKLDIGYIRLYQPCTAPYSSLLEAVTAMTQLASLKVSIEVGCSETMVSNDLAVLDSSFSGLGHLRELSVLCAMQQTWHIHTANLQSRWQALLKDTLVHVTHVSDAPVVQFYHYDPW